MVPIFNGGQNALACGREPFVVDPIQAIGVDVPLDHLRMCKHQCPRGEYMTL